MGARALSIEELTAENTEVRGFNGRAIVNCGFSLPIVFHQPTGLYCALSVTRTPGPVWSTEAEIQELEKIGRITLLSNPERIKAGSISDQVIYTPETVSLPQDWNILPRKQPVVIWVKGSFLRHLTMNENQLPYTFGNFSRWHRATPPQEDQTNGPYLQPQFYIGCTSVQTCEDLLDQWGKQAKVCFDKELTKEHRDWLQLESVADDGLCAARNHGLRYWLYVRYCACFYFRNSSLSNPQPERAYRLFQVFVQPVYQGITWKRFRQEMFVIVRWAQDVKRFAEGSSTSKVGSLNLGHSTTR